MLSNCAHPHIVLLFGLDEDAGLILELMVNGDVRALLKANPRVGFVLLTTEYTKKLEDLTNSMYMTVAFKYHHLA